MENKFTPMPVVEMSRHIELLEEHKELSSACMEMSSDLIRSYREQCDNLREMNTLQEQRAEDAKEMNGLLAQLALLAAGDDEAIPDAIYEWLESVAGVDDEDFYDESYDFDCDDSL